MIFNSSRSPESICGLEVTQEQLDNWQPVKVLLAPPGTKEVMFDDFTNH